MHRTRNLAEIRPLHNGERYQRYLMRLAKRGGDDLSRRERYLHGLAVIEQLGRRPSVIPFRAVERGGTGGLPPREPDDTDPPPEAA